MTAATPETQASSSVSSHREASFEASGFQEERKRWVVERPAQLATMLRTKLVPAESFVVKPEEQAAVKSLMPNLREADLTVEIQQLAADEKSVLTDSKLHLIGVILSGGPAPGGHNVVAGVYDAIREVSPESVVIGFRKGIDGLMKADYVELTDSLVDSYRNMGGFDMLFSGRGCVKPEQEPEALRIIKQLKLTGLVIVGGDGTNSNTAAIANLVGGDAECDCSVVGVPKTIDGDLANHSIEVSFGFDTAAKVYSEQIASIMTDVTARREGWHFIRVMGRLASHLVLECALQTHPNIVIIAEEVQQRRLPLSDIVDEIVDCIIARRKCGLNHGVVLVPEGLITFIPEMEQLITELSEILINHATFRSDLLTPQSAAVWALIPAEIRKQMLSEREASGYVQVAKIATEKFLSMMVEQALVARGAIDSEREFKHTHHYFGYEGRCAIPSVFDAVYTYSLGLVAAQMILHRRNGYMATLRNLAGRISEWRPVGVRFLDLLQMVTLPSGPTIAALYRQEVSLDGLGFKSLEAAREHWKLNDCYRVPGPVQYAGPCAQLANFFVNPPRTAEELLTTSSPMVEYRLGVEPKIPTVCASESVDFVREQNSVFWDASLEAALPISSDCEDSHSVLLPVHKSDEEITAARIGVTFVSDTSAGCNNLLYAMCEKQAVTVEGFIGGFTGLINDDSLEIDRETVRAYRNLGGAAVLGAGKLQVLSEDDCKTILETCETHELAGLVLSGGREALLEIAKLAEYFLRHQSSCSIIACPQSVHDRTDESLGISLGQTTNSLVQSSLIGNAASDASSMPKYYHFVRVDTALDDSAQVIECALATHPNVHIVADEHSSLASVIDEVVDCVERRSNLYGKDHGVVLLPRSLWRSIPELREMASATDPASVSLFQSLPASLTAPLLTADHAERVLNTPLEAIVALLVQRELKARTPSYSGNFQYVLHNLTYQGRGALPCDLDCSLGATMGAAAVLAVRGKISNRLISIKKTDDDFHVRFTPIPAVLSANTQGSWDNAKELRKNMSYDWQLADCYSNPGPVQFIAH